METNFIVVNQTVYDQPVIMLRYPHAYVIRINWTPTTYIGLALAILIALNTYILVGRWARATYRFGFDAETWNLLKPVDLMAYSLAAYQDLLHDLNTIEHRKAAMHGETQTVLREHPFYQGTQSLIGLVNSTKTHLDGTTTAGSSPVSPTGKTGSLAYELRTPISPQDTLLSPVSIETAPRIEKTEPATIAMQRKEDEN
jgi:hypothetical protein